MPVSDQLIDQLLADYKSPEDLLGEQGLLKQLTKKLAERALEAEMEQHLGYAKHDAAGKNSGNSRNGKSRKTVRSIHGDIEIETPRDRNGSFEPQLLKRGEKQLGGFDERIVSLYARGMSTRDIQAHFEDVYGVEVSPGLLQYLLQLFATGMDHCLHYHVSSRINLWTKRSRILVLFLVRKVN